MRVVVDERRVVVAVWVGIPGVGRASIVHAGVEVRARRVLVIEAEGVAYLLARDPAAPDRGVVVAGAEVAVVELDRGLRDVVAGRPDRRQPEPAVSAIRRVAELVAPAGRMALATRCLAGTDGRTQGVGRGEGAKVVTERSVPRPVRGRTAEVGRPRARHIVAELDGERIRRPRPVVRISGRWVDPRRGGRGRGENQRT